MLVESYDPFHNLAISALIASIPIILFLLCLTVFKMKGIYAAVTTLVVTLVIALFIFKLPVGVASGGIVEGFYQGILPIGFIVIMAVWLYKVIVESGQFSVVQDSITTVSEDQRIQLLLIGFAFNAFLEGVAGFGVPIAICAVLLIQLGFKPLQAAMLCLVANGAAGAYGAIGLPVSVIDTLALHGHISALQVSQALNLSLPILSIIVPFMLIFILDGMKGIKETLPAIIVTVVPFVVLQIIFNQFFGPELVDIIPPLASMASLALFSKKFQPKNIFRLNKDEQKLEVPHHSAKEIIFAWSPFIILTALVLVWSSKSFKGLFAEGGALSFFNLQFGIPGTNNDVSGHPIMLTFNIINQTGTALLLAGVITILLSKTVNFKRAGALLGEAFKELWLPILTICFILAIAKITTYGGLTNAMGEGISKTGKVFPFLSPILGWIGVFMTGSVTNNNALFAPIQASVAPQVGTSGALLVGANTAGGAIGKLISPQSIAIATAAVKQVGKESELLKMTLKYSVGLLIFWCIWTFILSLILS
ncbi:MULTISPECIES: L-lactate permease [Staphylococcus]|uniref:L-lactate permease n=1 Tax=Staphylococcus schleiferi TaxID=1295 RepID=A0ABX0FXJ3_STASC|nr:MULTISPECIES: L-lactate permease [Staphylococcus]QGS46153.1 L-lactate permease [Mammaliicoccus fleurettii]EPD48691.1 lactate permease (LctP) family transporter [Staphylococcus sp. HGB0015]MBF1993718.1 L-lactate permease [Staphylococcus schleiferi]MBF2039606.1 L-lactate permease [Staphylococcus schleiferi]MBF2101276.1 L-lactate permease [Staphylococcus schleiferi]